MIKSPIQLHTPSEIASLLAQRVRNERLRLDWKQQTLADRSGVTLATLRRFERTGRGSLENLLKLCHALGRIDEFADLLEAPPAHSIQELARIEEQSQNKRKRGTR